MAFFVEGLITFGGAEKGLSQLQLALFCSEFELAFGSGYGEFLFHVGDCLSADEETSLKKIIKDLMQVRPGLCKIS